MALRVMALLLLVLCLCPLSSNASNPKTPATINVDKLEIDDLSSNHSPYQIHNSQNGTIWLFYDTFLIIKTGVKTQRHRYVDILNDNNKRYSQISVASNQNELAFAVQDKVVHYHFATKVFSELILPTTTVRHKVQGIDKDPNDNIWIATNTHLFKMHANTHQIEQIHIPKHLLHPQYNSPIIVALSAGQSGNLWLASVVNGFVRLTTGNQFVVIDKSFDMKKFINGMTELDNQQVLLATLQGLFNYSLTDQQIKAIHPKTINSDVRHVVLQKNGQIWFVSQGQLWSMDKNLENLTRRTLNTPQGQSGDPLVVESMISDNENTLWISLKNQGLFKYTAKKNTLSSVAPLPGLKGARYFQAIGKKHYVAANATHTYISEHARQYPFVASASYQSKNNDYWFGSKQAVIKVDSNNTTQTFSVAKLERFPEFISSLLVDRDKRLWIVSRRKGLIIVDPPYLEQQPATEINIDQKVAVEIIAVFNDDRFEDQLLLIAYDGIYQYDLNHHQLIKTAIIAKDQALIESAVLQGDNIIIHHMNNQVLILNRKTHQKQPLNLPFGASGCAVEGPDNRWWFAQKYGKLARFGAQPKTYDMAFGVPRSGFNGVVCYVNNGALTFSSQTGLYAFNQRNDKTNTIAPTTTIDDVQIQRNGKPFKPNVADKLSVQNDNFPIKINLHSSSYAAEQQNRYQYRLSTNTDNKNSNQNTYRDMPNPLQQIVFDALSPDVYLLQMRTSNNDGVWSKPVSLVIDVQGPLWLTWWAKAAYVLLVFLAVRGFYHQRLKRMQTRATELEAQVQQRTGALNKEKQTVEALLRRKNQEFANVSHEFRTPLTLLLGPLAQVLKTNTDSTETQRLTIVQRNGYRLLRMVDQLLNIETFRVKAITQKAPLATGKTIRLLTESFADLAKEKNISLKVKSVVDINFEFTPDALEKIIVNLLSNAIKYTKSGGFITVQSRRMPNNTLRIDVQDSGIGIPHDMLESVFERYHRVLDENSEQVTGAGIGLALVKELVETHEGHISIASVLGKGTTVTINLPIIKEVQDDVVLPNNNDEIIAMELMNFVTPATPIEVNSGTQIEAQENTEQPTVLVIEDNADMRHYIISSIKHRYRVLSAIDGKQGLETAITEVPNIIICDVMMPKMDGYETTHGLRTNDITSHIPVILLTARGDRESRLKGWHQQADEYITKPFDTEELNIRINNLLEIRHILKKRFGQSIFENATEHEGQNNHLEQQFIDKLKDTLEPVYAQTTLNAADMATAVAMSERQLYRKMKSILDMTPAEYLRRFRLEKSKHVLTQGHSASYVAIEVGFSSQSYFGKCFKAQFGLSPGDFKKQGNSQAQRPA